MGLQTPAVPASAHDWQMPLQSLPQQTPCWQKPDVHWLPAVQAAPSARLRQALPMHSNPVAQSPVAAQVARQTPAVPQVYGVQSTGAPARQMPEPSQVPGSVPFPAAHVGATQTVPAT
jgi:hypothetical protein